MDIMTKRLGYEAVLSAFPKYGHLYAAVQSTQELIALTRKKRQERQDIYAEIEKI
jgi:hypothetical protein